MIKTECAADYNDLSGEKYKTDELNNFFKNHFSEAFFGGIYEKLKENLFQNNRMCIKEACPMLMPSCETKCAVNAESPDKSIVKEESKSGNGSPNPYVMDDPSKPLSHYNREDRFSMYKSPSQDSLTFLGRKTVKNKENNCNSNEIFRISKQNSGLSNNFNVANEEEDIRKYLECGEKHEEANKVNFENNNFMMDEGELFDFNSNNVNSNVNTTNTNNNINHSQEQNQNYF